MPVRNPLDQRRPLPHRHKKARAEQRRANLSESCLNMETKGLSKTGLWPRKSFLTESRFRMTGDNSMPRAFSFLTLFILLAFCTACGGEGTANNTNGSLPGLEKNDKITVQYPNLFLQDDTEDRGKITFELEEVFGPVHSIDITNGNTTHSIRTPDVNIRPLKNPDEYDIYVEVQLLTTGLTKTDPPNLKKLYTKGGRLLWEWNLKPVEGIAEGEVVSFRFQVDVKWEAKTPGASSSQLSDVWQNEFRVRVGPPASHVNAALYSSPIFAAGGVVAFGAGLKRRRKLSGAELEEEGIEDNPERVSNKTELEEEVSSTVYAPKQAGQGDMFLVQVFVHLPEQADGLDELAKEADEDAERRTTKNLEKKIKRGTELTFHLTMPGLDVDDPIQSCVWNGEPAWVQFAATVPEDCKPRSIVGTVTVSEASIPIGHLKFTFKITGDGAGGPGTSSHELVPAAGMVRYRQAFISYASKDLPEVLKRVQMLNLAKIKFFQDLLTFEPGDSWEKLLYDYIDRSDVFYLFWSTAASESEWVRKEVEYALSRKTGEPESGPEIIPVIIEGPPPARPPEELSFLHFNDKLIYFINTRENEAKPLDG
jgi:hypothetical protein